MKKLIGFSTIMLLFVMSSCKQNAADKMSDKAANSAKAKVENSKVGFPVMTFKNKEFDFGTINEDDKVTAEFHFTNTGESDLVITRAKASCGCTVPEYPKGQPIKPGEEGVIKAVFNSAHKPNKQRKTVTLMVNTKEGREVVTLKGFVTPKEK